MHTPTGSDPIDAGRFDRSLQRSHERREHAERRRRRRFRGRGLTISLILALALGGGGVAAVAAGHGSLRKGDHGNRVKLVQRALHVKADGAFGPITRRAVRRFQRRHDLTVDGIVGPQTAAALGLSHASSYAGRSHHRHRHGKKRRGGGGGGGSGTSALLDRIAQCESGGDPRATNGQYRGKYQFLRSTWASVGGHGDPAQASEREQDKRARILLNRAGTSPWPVCGQG